MKGVDRINWKDKLRLLCGQSILFWEREQSTEQVYKISKEDIVESQMPY